ncbi:MAG: flagellar hook-length control protein FliK [Lachnospiraceae bacterium]|nr:flagellar hook-length control protein FliK [Lachnospiraceae bacterium]
MTAINGMNAAALLADYTQNVVKQPTAQNRDSADFQTAFANAGSRTDTKPVGADSMHNSDSRGAGSDKAGTDGGNDINTKVKTDSSASKADKTAKDNDQTANKAASKSASETSNTAPEKEDALTGAVEKIVKETAELLGIDPEQLKDLMAQLGLALQDLLKPENVNMLTANVLADGDAVSLITDASVLDTARQINEMVNNVLADAGADVSAASAFIEDKGIDISEMLADVVGPEASAKADAGADENLATLKDADTQNASDVLMAAAPEENIAVNTEAKASTGNGNSGNTDHDTAHGFTDEHRLHDDRSAYNAAEGRVQEQFSQNTAQATENVSAAPESYLNDPARIVEQVIEHIKAEVKEDFTSLEMTLNPQSLGNVAVNLVSKNGALTAEFTTQTEAAKAALESQIVILKENLEQQGVKVDAVDVTVSSHAFEQNLEQGNDGDSEAEAAEKERLRKATRKIDLDGFTDGYPEDIDEADQVTVSMMQSDGNRMDYRA